MAGKTHSIKVSEENYNILIALQLPRETFDDVVTRMYEIVQLAARLNAKLPHMTREEILTIGAKIG